MRTSSTQTCDQCGTRFERESRNISKKCKHVFCTKGCFAAFSNVKVTLPCGQCGVVVTRSRRMYLESKSGRLYCNNSCAARYNNAHKTTGTRRSKLEAWLEDRLLSIYPDSEVVFNGTQAIQGELDIYFPSLKLAFELNGLFHYEPIYGPEKLARIQTNDTRKFQACLERGIELCIIDTSRVGTKGGAQPEEVYQVIHNLVTRKLEEGAGFEPAAR